MDKIEQQKIKEAKELLEKYAPEGEFLAYINKKEANLLKAYGGSGNPTKETNIPSFIAPWVLPAIMAASTVVSFMGSLNNQRNIVAGMKANRNQIINKNALLFHVKIVILSILHRLIFELFYNLYKIKN